MNERLLPLFCLFCARGVLAFQSGAWRDGAEGSRQPWVFLLIRSRDLAWRLWSLLEHHARLRSVSTASRGFHGPSRREHSIPNPLQTTSQGFSPGHPRGDLCVDMGPSLLTASWLFLSQLQSPQCGHGKGRWGWGRVVSVSPGFLGESSWAALPGIAGRQHPVSCGASWQSGLQVTQGALCS